MVKDDVELKGGSAACTYVCMQAHTHTHTHAHIHIEACPHVRTKARTHTQMHTNALAQIPDTR